jgi:hypothetical protein
MIDSRAATSPLLYRSPGFYPAQMASMSEGLSGMPSLTHAISGPDQQTSVSTVVLLRRYAPQLGFVRHTAVRAEF